MPPDDPIPNNLWKLTIKPSGQTDPEVTPADSFQFCRNHSPQVIGVGWGGIENPTTDKEGALTQVESHYGYVPSPVKDLVKNIEEEDHVWIYNKHDQTYHLTKVLSDWKYGVEDDWARHDIRHYREAEWRTIPKPLVAGAVTRRVTVPKTSQRMDVGTKMRAYSAFLFESDPSVEDLREDLDRKALQERLTHWDSRTFFAALDEDETEDLVALYLQEERGWRLLKSSTNATHPGVECQFQRLHLGVSETGYMQVKSGRHISLTPGGYRHYAEDGARVFLFSTAEDPYSAEEDVEGVETLGQDEIRSFAASHLELLPNPMTIKLGILSGVLGLPS